MGHDPVSSARLMATRGTRRGVYRYRGRELGIDVEMCARELSARDHGIQVS